MQRKTFDFNIAGLPFKLKSSHDEETVQQLVALVDQKMKEALAATKSGSFQSAAVLTALNLAEELILLKRRSLKEIDHLENQVQRIAQDLEQIPLNDRVSPL